MARTKFHFPAVTELSRITAADIARIHISRVTPTDADGVRTGPDLFGFVAEVELVKADGTSTGRRFKVKGQAATWPEIPAAAIAAANAQLDADGAVDGDPA